MNLFQALLNILTSPLFYQTTILVALPLIFTSIGGVFCEITGVTNIALEGIMKAGAFSSIAITYYTRNPWLGLLAGLVSGMIFAWLHGYVSIRWQANQVVSATAIILIVTGLAGFLMLPVFNQQGAISNIFVKQTLDASGNVIKEVSIPVPSSATGGTVSSTPGATEVIQNINVPKLPTIELPIIKDIPFIGQIFGNLSIFFYFAVIVIIASWFLLYKTPLGLRMRAVGENPKAADTLGVNVAKIRYFGVLMSGFLAALGGMYLSIGELGQFDENMPGGKGFIALAAMILGNWNPVGAMWASLLFGAAESLNIQLQAQLTLPSSIKALLNMLPFILTIIIVGGFVGKTRAPKSSGVPYEKE